MIKVLIVDDQVILRDSLKFMIEQDEEIEVTGTAGNGREALLACDKSMPHVVLMDIMMPGFDGVEGTKLIKEKYSSVKIVILTTFNDDENVAKALDNGADGYLLKDIKPDEIILAIKSVHKGLNILNKNTFSNITNKIKPAKIDFDKNNEISFTDREITIIREIVEGKSNREIASKLFLTEGTVKNIITGILSKKNFKDRTQLAVFAVKKNIV